MWLRSNGGVHMRRVLMVLAVLGLTASSAFTALAGGKCGRSCESSAQAKSGQACEASGSTASACEASGGKLTGHFDSSMSGVCRLGCATKLKYNANSVSAQPGAQPGRLTQCPVSGVVFAVDASRPHVRIGKDEYITCCDQCATRLKHDPRHYLRA